MYPAWAYKKQITITGQSNAGTGYQVKLLVGASVSAAGADFHVEGNSLLFPSAENDSGDLRFANAAEDTELSFYVESVSGSGASAIATVWVKVADDLGTNKDIFIYYGNVLATNVSAPRSTFNAFDKFQDSNYADQWSVTSGTWTENTADIRAANAVLDSSGSQDCPDQYEMTIDFAQIYSDYVVNYFYFNYQDSSNYFAVFLNSYSTNQQAYLQIYIGGSLVYNNGLKPWNRNTSFHTFKVTRYWTGSTYNFEIFFDGVSRGTYSNATNISFAKMFLQVTAATGSERGIYRNMRIRKFNATEPSFSTAGAETANTAGATTQKMNKGIFV